MFGAFFGGAIVCLGMSTLYHTFSCHSQRVGKIFSKLDYCGIALLIAGSFVPWLYYGFYCDYMVGFTLRRLTLTKRTFSLQLCCACSRKWCTRRWC